MAYRHTACSTQINLFTQDTPIPPRKKRIPVYRVTLVREAHLQGTYGKITNAATASALLQTYLADVGREYFVVVLLDRKHQVIGLNTVLMGSLTALLVHPREVFKPRHLKQRGGGHFVPQSPQRLAVPQQ